MRFSRIILDTYTSAVAPPLCHIKSIIVIAWYYKNPYPSSARTLTAIRLAAFATPYWLPPAIPLDIIRDYQFFRFPVAQNTYAQCVPWPSPSASLQVISYWSFGSTSCSREHIRKSSKGGSPFGTSAELRLKYMRYQYCDGKSSHMFSIDTCGEWKIFRFNRTIQ